MRIAFAGFRHPHILSLYRDACSASNVEIVGCFEEDAAVRASLAHENKTVCSYPTYAFAIIVIVFVAAAALFIGYKTLYTKKNGIETEATVSRIEEETQSDSDGISTSYNYYVQYTTAEGQSQEAVISNPGFKGFKVGEQIRIKYLPEKPNAAVWIKK